RHDGGDELDELARAEREPRGPRSLPGLAVHPALHRQIARVEVGLDPGAERTEPVEALAPGPLTILPLEVAGGHVIPTQVSQDVTSGLLQAHVPRQPPDDHAELGFVVDPSGAARIWDRV